MVDILYLYLEGQKVVYRVTIRDVQSRGQSIDLPLPIFVSTPTPIIQRGRPVVRVMDHVISQRCNAISKHVLYGHLTLQRYCRLVNDTTQHA